MHSVFKLISILSLLNLTILNGSVALSFTNPFSNPFGKTPYRSQLTAVDNESFMSTNPTNLNRPAVEPLTSKSKWPNMRFMRTFLRSGSTPPNANQLNSPEYGNAKYILRYNPSNDKQTVKQPAEPAVNTADNIGLIDWNKILTKLNQATGFKNAPKPPSDYNETSVRATKHPEFYSPVPNDKKEEEKESNLLNYLTTFFSNQNENETINAEKEKQLAKTKPIESPPPKNDAPSWAVDLFYFNDNLLAKKQIEVLVCDKTMAIIDVRKNRLKANESVLRTVKNCVLFDLEKRGKVSCSSTSFICLLDLVCNYYLYQTYHKN